MRQRKKRTKGTARTSRTVRSALVLAVLVVLVVLSHALAQGASSWPSFRADSALSGRAAGSLPAALKPLWKFKAKDGITSTAAIVAGAVYVGSLDGNLYALDLATGKVRWSYKATDEVKSSPAVRDGAVYFGDEMGTFHAVDAKTGARRWTFKAGSGITSSANFTSRCLVVGSYDQFLYCLSPRDGAVVWKVETDGYVHGSPAVAADGSEQGDLGGVRRFSPRPRREGRQGAAARPPRRLRRSEPGRGR